MLAQASYFASLLSDRWEGGSSSDGGSKDGGSSESDGGGGSAVGSTPHRSGVHAGQRRRRSGGGGGGGGGGHGRTTRLVLDHEGAAHGADTVRELVGYLYGKVPDICDDNVVPLLDAASFFGVPRLAPVVAAYVFAHLTPTNVVPFLNLVHDVEYGDAGKLIEDAALAFLYRNALEVGIGLADLPLVLQARILIAEELFVPTEWDRYKLAVGVKRAALRRAAALRTPSLCDDAMAPTAAPPPSPADGVPVPAPPALLPPIDVPAAFTAVRSPAVSTTRVPTSPRVRRCKCVCVCANHTHVPRARTNSLHTPSLQGGHAAAAAATDAPPPPPPLAVSVEEMQYAAALQAIATTYAEVFASVRFIHFQPGACLRSRRRSAARPGVIPVVLKIRRHRHTAPTPPPPPPWHRNPPPRRPRSRRDGGRGGVHRGNGAGGGGPRAHV